jgi:hypothetical protein
MSSTTSAVLYVNDIIFHTAVKVPEPNTLRGHLKVVKLCQT